MSLPDPIPSNAFLDNELVNATKLYLRVWTKVNAIIDFLSGAGTQAGGAVVTVPAGTDPSATLHQTFDTAFDNIPTIVAGTATSEMGWDVSAVNATTSGFDLFVSAKGSTTSVSHFVGTRWIATGS